MLDGAPQVPSNRERALILAALNQVKGGTTWTSQPASAAASGTVSPDAPTAAESSHPSQPRADALPGRDAFPGYEIQREIHRGGQGVVYLATQLNTKRRVAVKVVHGGATIGSAGKTRFEREVQLLGQLNHPNVVKLHDSGQTADGSLFFVMDYVSGRALDEVLRERKREMRHETSTGRSRARSRAEGADDIATTLAFFAKVCDGVNAAHLKGVIHRDIKPANIRVDQNGEPVLVDFGLAKVTAGVDADADPSNPMTMTGQFVGSLPWASPEQAVGSGDAIDLRSDVYSLGVVLYQLLTGGRFPYTVVGNMRDVLDNIQRTEPERPSTIRRQINDEIETIVLTALAKERDRRYQSAGELARDIRRYLRGEPIAAKRDAGWYVIRKILNRHRAAVAVAAAVALLITGSAVGMTGLWRQAEGARAVAVVERDRAEDNLDAVRDLANTFLYDFNDAISNLRGATKAREAVLNKALEYLAILEAQPGRSADTIDALADAHERAGDLYGGLYAANTGTTAQAMEHYQIAKDLRIGLVQDHPQDSLYRSKLAQVWQRIGESLFKRESFDESLAAYQSGHDLAQAAGDTAIRAAIMTRMGDVHKRVAREVAQEPDAFNLKMELAERLYDEAEAHWATVDSQEAARHRAILASKLAQSTLMRGQVALVDWEKPDEARPYLEAGGDQIDAAVKRFEQLRASNPSDYPLARDLWVTIHYLGQFRFDYAGALDSIGEPAAADQARLQALDTFTHLNEYAGSLAADLSNLEAQRDLVISQLKLGNTLRALDRLDEARAVFAECAQLRDAILASDPVERHLRDSCVVYYKLAEIDEMLAERAANPSERRALLLLSRTEYTNALDAINEYVRRGGSADSLVRTVEDAIARVNMALES
jgi:non-specific serine/threonine protein kinase/serine/threonine-protein kinase